MGLRLSSQSLRSHGRHRRSRDAPAGFCFLTDRQVLVGCEWQVIEGQRYPHHIFSENDETFAFAGLWKSINQRKVFSILTRSAAANILHIHHRAPVALTENYWELWLDEKQSQDSLRTVTDASQPVWTAQQVSSRVNSTRNNDPEILNPDSGKQSLLF